MMSGYLPISEINATNIIHVYTTEKGRIWALSINKEMNFFLENENKLKKIEEIVANSFSNMTDPTVRIYLQISYPRLSQLNDGSYKLYLSGRLLGGGKICKELQTKLKNSERWKWDSNVVEWVELDKWLSEYLHLDLPRKLGIKGNETFLVITRTSHIFLGIRKDARKITFSNPPFFKATNWVFKPFSTYFFGAGSSNGAAEAILGSENSNDIDDLQNAFFRNKTIIIYVSKDLEDMEVDCQ